MILGRTLAAGRFLNVGLDQRHTLAESLQHETLALDDSIEKLIDRGVARSVPGFHVCGPRLRSRRPGRCLPGARLKAPNDPRR